MTASCLLLVSVSSEVNGGVEFMGSVIVVISWAWFNGSSGLLSKSIGSVIIIMSCALSDYGLGSGFCNVSWLIDTVITLRPCVSSDGCDGPGSGGCIISEATGVLDSADISMLCPSWSLSESWGLDKLELNFWFLKKDRNMSLATANYVILLLPAGHCEWP